MQGEISGKQRPSAGSRRLPLIIVPSLKSLLEPSRNLKVTVPGVVGVHSSVVGWPAVRENPGGILNGLSEVWATTDDNRTVTRGRIERCILAFWTRFAGSSMVDKRRVLVVWPKIFFLVNKDGQLTGDLNGTNVDPEHSIAAADLQELEYEAEELKRYSIKAVITACREQRANVRSFKNGSKKACNDVI